MKDLAILGASYLQLPLIRKAKDMGYVTHVFAWAANDVGEREADYFYPISITEKEEILEKCREIGICGICTIASDLAAIAVNYVANKMGLNGNSIEASQKSTNKHLMREAFAQNGDPSPKSMLVDEKTDINLLEIDFPAIVKPTDRSGSRGIYKVESREQLKEAIGSAMKEGFEKKALVEEFADGTEYSVEYISFRGEHHFLAMTLKYTTGAPHFIETGHLQPAPVDDKTLEKVKKVVEHALDSLEITNGASHSELRIDADGNIKIIEIGGRMGGDFIGSDMVRYSTGVDFLKCTIQVACGEEPDLTADSEIYPVEVRFILTEEDDRTFIELQQKNPESVIEVKDYHPEKIGVTTDSSNRAGCYLIRA